MYLLGFLSVGEVIAECMIELTRLLHLTDPSAVLSDTQQQSGSVSDSSLAVLCSLYEFWYTRSLLILLSSHCDEDKKRSMLHKLAEYNRTPGLLQLATDINMLYSDQVGCTVDSHAAIFNVVYRMVKFYIINFWLYCLATVDSCLHIKIGRVTYTSLHQHLPYIHKNDR